MRYSVIAIEREYASGGQEIGEKVAARLGVPCYGERVLELAAEKMGSPVQALRDIEETMTGSFLYSLYMLASTFSGGTDGLTAAQRLSITEAEIIREMAMQPCVIVGRSAAGILREQENVLRVFIYADEEARVRRAVDAYGEDPKHVEVLLQRSDKRRSVYFKANTGVDWKHPQAYHLLVNSGAMGIDAVAQTLGDMVQRQDRR